MIILYSKSMRLFVSKGFLVSHRGLRKPRHFYGLSPLGIIYDHNWWVFYPRGDLPLVADTWNIFSISCNCAILLDIVSFTKPTQSTPNAVSIYQPCTHTQLNAMPPCIYNAKCHYMLSHVTCIMNTTLNNL